MVLTARFASFRGDTKERHFPLVRVTDCGRRPLAYGKRFSIGCGIFLEIFPTCLFWICSPEAASNGAARVVMLEKDRKTASAISLVISKLQAQDVAQCFAADAFVWLKQSDEVFDVIFIDPPFALSLHQQAVQAALPHLKEDGFIYLENESEISDELLRSWGLETVRRGKAGAVCYLLCVPSIR